MFSVNGCIVFDTIIATAVGTLDQFVANIAAALAVVTVIATMVNITSIVISVHVNIPVSDSKAILAAFVTSGHQGASTSANCHLPCMWSTAIRLGRVFGRTENQTAQEPTSQMLKQWISQMCIL